MGSWSAPWPAQENRAMMAGPSDRAEIQGRIQSLGGCGSNLKQWGLQHTDLLVATWCLAETAAK